MISHQLKEMSVLLVLVFIICCTPVFAFAEESKTSNRVINDTDYFYNLGRDYRESGKYQEAIDAFKQAIRINPDHYPAYSGLGDAYVNLDKYQEAIDAYKQANRIMPDFADAHFSLSLVYVNLSKYQEAVYALKQAIKIKSDSAEKHQELGHDY